jgi:hypothetical protein
VTSLEIHNARIDEDNNNSSLISCSISIVRSTFRLTDPTSQLTDTSFSAMQNRATSNQLAGTEYLPRLDLAISSRLQPSFLPNNKIYNDTLHDHILTRRIILQRPLTRADHNGTVQCHVESNNLELLLVKSLPIDIQCE